MNVDQSQCDEMYINSSQRVESTVTPESTVMRTLPSGEITSHEQVFSVELEVKFHPQQMTTVQR